jgi:eukaryotic-like serine/threonine-protein kinase
VPLQIEMTPTEHGTRVSIVGIVDEDADLSSLRTLMGKCEVNLAGVRRINSFGARSWMDALRAAAKRAQLVFVECSPPIIDQLNMIRGFLAHGSVRSFYAPMLCERCNHETLHLFDVEACRDNYESLPPVPCSSCGAKMELDDLEDQYLLFIREPTSVRD